MSTEAQQLLKGRFEILEEIGEGGFARVFRARETTTGQAVAVKVLKDGFQNDPEVIERFRREVFAVASIDSPHVVGLKDFGISGDEFFIAMEFVEGPTLRDVIEQHEWSAESVHTLIGQVAAALTAAHAQNIVHRDLKPENVMLVSGPNDTMIVKVLDFGLAKLAELERNLGLAPLTRVGMCFGTPQYMSPELIYGKPVDRSVDLFALAVMSYEMIAGHRPWDGPAPQEVMVSVVKKPFAPLERVHASMARRIDVLNRFFLRVLAKKKDDRPGSADEFFAELSDAILGERRPVKVPSLHESTSELSAIYTMLPGRPRPDETQLDMSPAIKQHAHELSGEKTSVEFHAMPTASTDSLPTQAPLGDAEKKNARLSSVWIPSIVGAPVLEDADDYGESAPTLSRKPVERETAEVYVNAARTVAHPAMERRRSRWLPAVLIGGLVLLMAAAASIGFFIGRGN